MHQQHGKTFLIHGFSPVNARLLTVYGTAFHAITLIQCWFNGACHLGRVSLVMEYVSSVVASGEGMGMR